MPTAAGAAQDAAAPAAQEREDAKAERKRRREEAARRIDEANAEADRLAAAHEYDDAVAALERALRDDDSAMYTRFLLSKAARLRYVQGKHADALDLLARVERHADGSAAGKRAKSYVYSTRSQVYLELGLIDLAYRWARESQAVVAELVKLVAEGGKPIDFGAERDDALRAEARVLASMESWGELDRLVTDQLAREEVSDPLTRCLLHSYRGIGLKELSRTDPTALPRAKADLDAALAGSHLPGGERFLIEVALAELALREADVDGARRRLAQARAIAPAADAPRASQPQLMWLALSARLRLEHPPESEAEPLEATRDALAAAFEERRQSWLASELRPGGYGFLQYVEVRALASELVRLELALAPGPSGVARALERVLAAGGCTTLARRIGAPPVGAEAARAALAPGHALLVYFPAPERTHLFVVDRERVEHVELEPRDVIEQARAKVVAKLRRPLARGAARWETEQRAEAICELSRLLIPGNARARLNGASRLSIVGRDLLGEVPFEALRVDGEYLGLRHAIAAWPSVDVGVFLQQRAAQEPPRQAGSAGEVLLVAAPETAGVEVSPDDLDEIVAAHPAASRRVLRGSDATFAGLAHEARAASVLEVLTHGRRDDARERSAGFLLASPGGDGPQFVGAEELETIDAPPLVVLAVCGGGFAPKRRGDAGAADLAGAFLSAGGRARCVILAPYDLEVEAARRLSIGLHAALAAGDSPAEALRAARAQLAREEGFADPFYFALIGAVGAAHAPIFAPAAR